jgi:large subunit ribosomal protein L5
MVDFLEKFFNLVLPRLRDFRGISPTSFDQKGSYNMTIKDQTYFPEIDLNKINKIRPLQITIVTSATTQKEAKMLLSALGAKFLES